MAEPLSLEVVKARLGIASDHRDAELADLIPAARETIEEKTGHILVRRTIEQFPIRFDGCKGIALHAWPIVSLDSIHYLDGSGVEQALVGGRLTRGAGPQMWLFPAVNATWPVCGTPAGIRLTMTAGYQEAGPDAAPIPRRLVTAMLLLIGHWFENHEAVVVGTSAVELPLGVADICEDIRLPCLQ